jgi:hypothetical protein
MQRTAEPPRFACGSLPLIAHSLGVTTVPSMANTPPIPQTFQFLCQGCDISSVTVSRNASGRFDLVFSAYVLERHRSISLRGLSDLPDLSMWFNSDRVRIVEDADSQRESGRVHVEYWLESYSEFWADEAEDLTP